MPFLAPLPAPGPGTPGPGTPDPGTPTVPERWVPAATVDLRQLPVSGRWKVYFEVLTPFGYTSRPADEQTPAGPVWRGESVEQRVPAGLVTDLASVPMPLWGVIASYGRQTLPAVLHDAWTRALADSGGSAATLRAGRRDADRLFRSTLRESGTGPVRRWLMWSAVRIFGNLPLAVVFLLAVVAGVLAVGLAVAGGDGTAGAWLVGALITTAAALAVLLVLVAWAGIESGIESRPGRRGAERSRWVPGATGSLLGATGIGLVALPLLLPLIVLTFVTELVVGLGEGGPAGVRVQGRGTGTLPATRITYAPPAT